MTKLKKNYLDLLVAGTLSSLLAVSVCVPRIFENTSSYQSSGCSLESTNSGSIFEESGEVQELMVQEEVVCSEFEDRVEKLFSCNQEAIDLYAEISLLPQEFVAAQIYHESRFNPFVGQGAGFGRGQIQRSAFLDTMRALAGRPDLSGVKKGLKDTVLQNQYVFKQRDKAQFGDSSLDQYVSEIDLVISNISSTKFSIKGYQTKTQANIQRYSELDQEYQDLINDESTPTPHFTNRREIREINKEKRQLVKTQKKLNKELDLAINTFWKDYIKWDKNDADDIKSPNGDHLWYEIKQVPTNYARVTDIINALNMRRVYGGVDMLQDSKKLPVAIANYRIGPNGIPSKGTNNYIWEVLLTYKQLSSNNN
mgnify:CR=1 FL=1